MRTLVVGDIHGCYSEFLELLDKAGLAEDDEIIALGDIVNRGPDSDRVIQFFMNGSNTRSVLGNHEHRHLTALSGDTEFDFCLAITRRQLGEKSYHLAIGYISRLPSYIELDDVYIVHGFYEPGIPIDKQRDDVLVGLESGSTYLRQAYEDDWFDLYDGDKPIIVGHCDYGATNEPMVCGKSVYAIDTGCVRGGALTGLLLPEFKLISVPSRRNYWDEMRKRCG